MKAADFDPMTSAVVEGDGTGLAAESAGASNVPSTGNVSITEYASQYVRIAVNTPRTELLVLTESYYPGRTATVDGVDTPILPTDIAFRGVVVPAGSHSVIFAYAPHSFWIGVGAALAGLALLVFAVWRSHPAGPSLSTMR
jgi:uncharacterized membrane protein YfhO